MRKLIGSLLTLALTLAISTLILDMTLLHAAFLEQQANRSGIYNQLSQAFVQAASNGQTDPQTETTIKQLATPTYVKSKIEGFVNQLEPYLRQGQGQPAINLSDLVSQAQAQGLPLPPDAQTSLNKNLLQLPARTNAPLRQLPAVKWGSWLAVAVLASLLWLVGGRRFRAWSGPLVSTGVLLALSAGVWILVTPWLADQVLTKIGSQIQLSDLKPLIMGIGNTVGKYYVMAAALCWLLAVVAWFVPAPKSKPAPAIKPLKKAGLQRPQLPNSPKS